MLLRIIAGLIYPTEGVVTIHGDIIGKDVEFPPSLGLLIENPAFLNRYDSFENLCILNSLSRETIPEEKIRSLVKRVGLDSVGTKKFRKYSLGMKQRLGLAAAVLGEPDLILLDEPTNAFV